VREVATSRRQPRRVNKVLHDQNNFGKSSSKEVLIFNGMLLHHLNIIIFTILILEFRLFVGLFVLFLYCAFKTLWWSL